MKKEDVLFLKQLVNSLGELGMKLENYYREEDHDNFNKTKKTMLKIQREIAELVK